MNDTTRRFLQAIVERLPAGRIVELRLFPAIRQGTMESGVAVVALDPATDPDAGSRTDVVSELVGDDAGVDAGAALSGDPDDLGDEGAGRRGGGSRPASATDASLDAVSDLELPPSVTGFADRDEESDADQIAPESDGSDDRAVRTSRLEINDTELAADERETPMTIAFEGGTGTSASGTPRLAEIAPESDVEVVLVAGVELGEGAEPPADDSLVLADILALPSPTGTTAPIDRRAPHIARYAILSARYRLTIKGEDRGKWEMDVTHEADAPLDTVERVARGVARRAGDESDPEHFSGESLHAALAAPAWLP